MVYCARAWYVTGMPTENDKTVDQGDEEVVLPDPRDEQINQLQAQVAELQAQLKAAKSKKGPQLLEGDYVSWRGEVHQIIGDFRADNTFAEVKRGHCPEGVTLLAIARPH